MGRTVWCPSCSAGLDVGAYAAGQRIRCGECKTVLLVPDDVPEVAPLPPPAPVAPTPTSRRAFGRRGALRGPRRHAHVPNLLPWAILATLLCCQIGGILAIVFSVQANSAADRGDVHAARRAEKNARMWLWISALTLPVVIAFMLLVYLPWLNPQR